MRTEGNIKEGDKFNLLTAIGFEKQPIFIKWVKDHQHNMFLL